VVARRIINGMWCVFVERGRQEYLAAVQVHFKEGGCRDYAIWCRTSCASGKARKKPQWEVRSLVRDRQAPPIDLRNRAHAKMLEKELLAATEN
jgi:hypothetical protein